MNGIANINYRFGFDPIWIELFLEVYNKTKLKRNNKEQVMQAFMNSQIVVSAWIDDRPVAVGRAISDFKMYSSIFDIVVDPNFQKMGLGKEIMKCLLQRLDGTLVYLTSTFGNEKFYKNLGFRFHKSAMALYPERLKNTEYLCKEYFIPESLQSHNEFNFFLANATDIEGCFVLNPQLGYKTDFSGFSKRFRYLINSPEHSIVIAKRNNEVVGWMHLAIRRLLENEDFAQLAAVVVSEKVRGFGVGTHFIKIAEDWARYFEFKTVGLNSSFPREKAHEFYLKNGYTHLKNSKLFIKKV